MENAVRTAPLDTSPVLHRAPPQRAPVSHCPSAIRSGASLAGWSLRSVSRSRQLSCSVPRKAIHSWCSLLFHHSQLCVSVVCSEMKQTGVKPSWSAMPAVRSSSFHWVDRAGPPPGEPSTSGCEPSGASASTSARERVALLGTALRTRGAHGYGWCRAASPAIGTNFTARLILPAPAPCFPSRPRSRSCGWPSHSSASGMCTRPRNSSGVPRSSYMTSMDTAWDAESLRCRRWHVL